MKSRFVQVTLPVCAVIIIVGGWFSRAGDLNPPAGPIAATNRVTLNQQSISLPYIISQSGSYVLTSNLMGLAGQHGIVVNASDVTLDLNGFSLIGVPGSQHGIFVAVPGSRNITVLNGSVRGWGQRGADLRNASACHMSRVRAVGNGTIGIGVGPSSVASECNADGNQIGFASLGTAQIRDCAAASNSGDGYQLDEGGLIKHSRATNNAGRGILATKSLVDSCVSRANGGHGVEATTNCVIKNCPADGNGTSSVGAGVRTSGDLNRIEGNHATDNDVGFQIDGVGNLVIKNSAKNNTTDFTLASACTFGPIVPSGNGGSLATLPDGTHSWANFSLTCIPQNWCRDQDGDQYGNANDTVNACASPPGYVGDCSDCDDTNANLNPGASELCNGIDDNCNAEVDEGNPGGGEPCDTGLSGPCAVGISVCAMGTPSCVPVNQPSNEVCDGIDNDCDGQTDEGNPGGGVPCNTGLPGVCAAGTRFCSNGALICIQNVQPSAEICDGLDNNCNGVVDEGCPSP